MGRFDGKVVLVTGGARNTGLEIVDLFMSEGAEVFFCTRSPDSLKGGIAELERRGRAGFHGIRCDVGERADVDALMDEIERTAGRIDVVVSMLQTSALGRGLHLRRRTNSLRLSST